MATSCCNANKSASGYTRTPAVLVAAPAKDLAILGWVWPNTRYPWPNVTPPVVVQISNTKVPHSERNCELHRMQLGWTACPGCQADDTWNNLRREHVNIGKTWKNIKLRIDKSYCISSLMRYNNEVQARVLIAAPALNLPAGFDCTAVALSRSNTYEVALAGRTFRSQWVNIVKRSDFRHRKIEWFNMVQQKSDPICDLSCTAWHFWDSHLNHGSRKIMALGGLDLGTSWHSTAPDCKVWNS